MKRIALMLMLLCSGIACASSTGNVYHGVTVVDDYGELTLTEVTIYKPNTTTEATIYADHAETLPITQPMTTTSTNTTLANGFFSWYGPDGYDYKIKTSYRTQDNYQSPSLNASVAQITMLGTLALDNELYAIASVTPAANKMGYWSDASTFTLFSTTAVARGFLTDPNGIADSNFIGLDDGSSYTTFGDGNDLDLNQMFAAVDTAIGALAGGHDAVTVVDSNTIDLTLAAQQLTADVNETGLEAILDLADLQGTLSLSQLATTGSWTPTATLDISGATVTFGLEAGDIPDLSASYQAVDAEITALAGLTSAANKVPYWTGSGTASVTDFTAYARTLLDDSAAATARATLGIDANWSEVMEGEGAATDAEVRTWKGDIHLDHVIDVRDYGATGDGVTDDYAAVAAAIAAAPSGSTVYFPPGIYLISQALTLKAYITYRGSGHRYCQLRASAANSDSIFTFAGISHVVVEKLAFSSANHESAYIFKSSDLTAYMEYTTFRDCDFYCDHHTSVYASFGNVQFTRCRFGYLGDPSETYRPIYGGDVTESIYVFSVNFKGCWFYNANSTDGNDAAVHLITGSTVAFDSCIWQSCEIPAYKSQGIRNTLMTNCNFEDVEPNVDGNIDAAIVLLGMPVSLVPGNLLMINSWFQNNGYSNGQPWESVAYCTQSGEDAKATFIACSGAFGDGYWTHTEGGSYDLPKNTTVLAGNVVGNNNSTFDTYWGVGKTPRFYLGLEVANGSDGAGYADFYEDSDNGSNTIRVRGPSSTADANLTLPTATEIGQGGYLYTDTNGTITTEASASLVDTAYPTGWDGDDTNVPSVNKVYDAISGLAGGHDAATVLDSQTIDLTLSTQQITADVTYQDSNSISWSVDASGLKVDVNEPYLVTVAQPLDATLTELSEWPIDGNDPDVDAIGEIGRDVNDHSLRGYDGTNQYVYGQKFRTLNVLIPEPNTWDSTYLQEIWTNRTGFTFNITAIYARSDVDDVDYGLVELTDLTNYSLTTTIEAAIAIDTDGTGVYYDSVTSGIDHTTIEDGHSICYQNSGNDDPNWVKLEIVGWLDANVD